MSESAPLPSNPAIVIPVTPELERMRAEARELITPPTTLEEANLRIATLERELRTTREDIQRLRNQVAGGLPVEPALTVEPRPEPELQMDDAMLEEVDTRRPLERIRDGVANGVKAWLHNLDPRDKDWAWRIGAITGVTESTLTSIAVIPGGRIAVSALNFLAAQGVYAGVKVAEKVTIARMANEGPVDNDQVQAILDARERYQNADHKIRNFFMGLSAGMTAGAVTSALIHGAYSLGENLLSGHDVATPVVAKAPEVVKKFVVKPFGWTPGAETFNSTVTIPDHGNFWSAWHIDTSSAANWADLHNGTTHTDVIKDMVIKLARANGHELGLVHAGDQIELAKVLTPDQLDLVRKAAAAKSYAEYSQAIRPAYHVLLKK